MDLRQIEAFVVVATCGSFTGAARRLHLTQSAVSQKIASLESEVGEELFVRDSRGVHLSVKGERMLPAAQDVLLSWNTLLTQSSDTARVEGRLSVGASGLGSAYLWASLYREFGVAYPDVILDLRATSGTQDSLNAVRSGTLDIALSVLPKETDELTCHALGVQEAVLCVPRMHPLTRRKFVTQNDLRSERFILLQPSASIRWLTDIYFRRENFEPSVVLESNDVHLIKGMIQVGYGIGFLPDWSVQDSFRSRAMRRLTICGDPLTQEFGLVYRQHHPSRAARAFIDFAIEHQALLPETTKRFFSATPHVPV